MINSPRVVLLALVISFLPALTSNAADQPPASAPAAAPAMMPEVTYELTDTALAALKSDGVPDAVLGMLKLVKDTEHSEADFRKLIGKLLDGGEIKQWQDTILKRTKKIHNPTEQLFKSKYLVISTKLPNNTGAILEKVTCVEICNKCYLYGIVPDCLTNPWATTSGAKVYIAMDNITQIVPYDKISDLNKALGLTPK